MHVHTEGVYHIVDHSHLPERDVGSRQAARH
jgi:hypothetical protein